MLETVPSAVKRLSKSWFVPFSAVSIIIIIMLLWVNHSALPPVMHSCSYILFHPVLSCFCYVNVSQYPIPSVIQLSCFWPNCLNTVLYFVMINREHFLRSSAVCWPGNKVKCSETGTNSVNHRGQWCSDHGCGTMVCMKKFAQRLHVNVTVKTFPCKMADAHISLHRFVSSCWSYG